MPWSHWHMHPEVWALCALVAGAYAFALRRAPETQRATRGQIRNFSLSVLALFVSAEWPVHDIAEGSLYSVHMVQHLILTMAFAPLLLTGLPPWMIRRLLPAPLMRVARALTRPLIALAIFNAVLVFTHWPSLVSRSVGDELTHFAVHTLIVASALIMWTPVLSPVLELPKLSHPGQMLYLFLQSLVPTVPASFLTFGARPLYRVYEPFPRPWGISALEDQRAAGLIMKIIGGAILWGVITAIYFTWYKVEKNEGIDELGYRDVDHGLNRTELTKR